ncbi:MAG: hypothetical protein OFPII_28990 [Osedax symbiont Rs1]|nr:MAG: hypothetical protein OFPII_28990 [Osedax symbiont Rs1]
MVVNSRTLVAIVLINTPACKENPAIAIYHPSSDLILMIIVTYLV